MNYKKTCSFILWFSACACWLNASTAPPLMFQTADALTFGGTDGYVSLGQASKLGLANFTLECWVRREGSGATAFTGNGGLNAIPLLAKGRAEADGSTLDMNYFLGIDGNSGVLAADFEDKITGANHPVLGVTPLRWQTWYHAAVTYDGAVLRLFLNGALESELNAGKAARNDSVQPASLATALDSSNTPEGFFAGTLDEVRIWNYARPRLQIADGMRTQIAASLVPSAAGLIARWGLNDGLGTVLANSVSASPTGTIQGTNWQWSSGVKFATNRAPFAPVLLAPNNNAVSVPTTADLRVTVTDANSDNLFVTAYGRIAGKRGADFSLVVLPDTQYYAAQINGGTAAMFTAQTRWIVQQRAALNIAYVAHLGDVVENGDNLTEWNNAQTALHLLEDPVTTTLRDGIPYGLAVGNHDQSPAGTAIGATTTLYNQVFGTTRFRARNYYGGRYSNNQDNHYQLFSASGMDFLVVYLEYDTAPDAKILNWADALLKTYARRRTIIVSHSLLEISGAFTAQGQIVYDKLKNNANLFLLLCGHNAGESRRQDTFNGQIVHTLLADFQALRSGGDGWLRRLEFAPAQNRIHVTTYSPTLDLFDRSAASQFDLPYNLDNSGFALLGSGNNFASGTQANFRWAGLQANTEYEWYVTVSDGLSTTVSPTWKFRTGAN